MQMISSLRIIGRVKCGIVSMMYMKKTSVNPKTGKAKTGKKKAKKSYKRKGVSTGRYSSNG